MTEIKNQTVATLTEGDVKDLSAARNERVLPLVQKIYELLGTKKLQLGEIPTESDKNEYFQISQEVVDLMLEAKLTYYDRIFLFQILLQPIEQLKDIVLNAIETSFAKANEKMWKKDVLELSLEDIDAVLKKQD